MRESELLQRRSESTARVRMGRHGEPRPGLRTVNQPGVRLGEWLVHRKLINRTDLYVALEVSYKEKIRFGDALVSLGVMQRPRVESEVVALAAARLSDGRIRDVTPPPLPHDALGESAPARAPARVTPEARCVEVELDLD
jgi:hypothetical protein